MIFVSLAFAASCVQRPSGAPDGDMPVQDAVSEEHADVLGFCPDSLAVVEGTVRSGQFFSSLMTGLGLSAKEAYEMSRACDSVFDVRNLRVGNAYRAYYSDSCADGSSSGSSDSDVSDGSDDLQCQRLEYVVYDRDRASSVVFSCRPPYRAWIFEKPVAIESRYADVTIKSSLWNDMRAAGVSPLLILSLSDIYAWSVDFFGLQKGDRFRVLYDERVCDGEVLAVDTVRYAIFSHAGEELPMIMFDQKDGGISGGTTRGRA